MTLWNKLDKFPILFQPLSCLAHHDTTHDVLEFMNKLTPMCKFVFKTLYSKADPGKLQKEIEDFLMSMEQRGVLTCLGVRKTSSSVDTCLPPDKHQLLL
jgi:hypothetical protein